MAAGAARLVERILISERKSVQKIVEAWQGHLVSTFSFECAKRGTSLHELRQPELAASLFVRGPCLLLFSVPPPCAAASPFWSEVASIRISRPETRADLLGFVSLLFMHYSLCFSPTLRSLQPW
jgi:hypothetical protein